MICKNGTVTVRSVLEKDYPVVLRFLKSQEMAAGFTTYKYECFSLGDLRDMFNSSEGLFFFVIEASDLFVGFAILNLEWQYRNCIMDIIFSGASGMSYGLIGLTEIIKYCRSELNLRRIELKLASTNRLMRKMFRMFPKNQESLIDIYSERGQWPEKIRAHYNVSLEEYQVDKESLIDKFVKETILSIENYDVTLRHEFKFNSQYIDYSIASFLLENIDENIDDILLITSGNYKKTKLYKRLTSG